MKKYRNVIDLYTEEGDVIEAGSLFTREENIMTLVDDDQYITYEYSEEIFTEKLSLNNRISIYITENENNEFLYPLNFMELHRLKALIHNKIIPQENIVKQYSLLDEVFDETSTTPLNNEKIKLFLQEHGGYNDFEIMINVFPEEIFTETEEDTQ